MEINKKDLGRIIISALLLVITLVVKNTQLKFILYLIAYIIVGIEVILEAIENTFKGKIFDENFLMTIATIGAFFIREYPEAVAVMLFYKVGELFEEYAEEKSRKSISTLMDIKPDYANLKIGEEIKKVHPEEVNIGDIIVIKPGEKVPIDGIIKTRKNKFRYEGFNRRSCAKEC